MLLLCSIVTSGLLSLLSILLINSCLWKCSWLHFKVVIQISLSSQKPSPSRGKKGRWGPCLHKRRYRSQKKLSVQEKQIWNFESEFIVWSASQQVCGDASVVFTKHPDFFLKLENLVFHLCVLLCKHISVEAGWVVVGVKGWVLCHNCQFYPCTTCKAAYWTSGVE